MSETSCSGSCSSCEENCSSRQPSPEDFLEAPHQMSHVKKIIGVVSGKGGVGKSLVTSLTAVELRKKGLKVGILDADITGPSIPKIFGVTEKATGDDLGIYPAVTKSGIEIMSVNLLLPDDTDPVVWRGPIIAGTVKQFWTEVIWADIDVLLVDMPPGTGDVPLTVFQSLPVDGIVIVASPQELVSMIVTKALKMAQMMNIPILGLAENMSYVACPDCGKKIRVFGETSNVEKAAAEFKLPVLASLPIDPKIAAACDAGTLEDLPGEFVPGIVEKIMQEEK